MTPPPEMEPFHVTTSSDCATSAPSPAAIASAVWNSVAQPPKAIPQAATLMNTTAGSRPANPSASDAPAKMRLLARIERAQPAVDQDPGDPDADNRGEAEDEEHKVDALAQARRNNERRDIGVEDVMGEDEGEGYHQHRAHAGIRERLTHRRALAGR